MNILIIKSRIAGLPLLLVMLGLCIPTANAQFLGKLTKRVEQKVENAVIEKAADKAAQKATKSMDKMFDGNPFGGKAGKEKADPTLVAESYDFNWKYSLKMSTQKGDLVLDYYLKPDATYFGFSTATMSNMFTVMDNNSNITAMFMQSDGNNIGMVTQIPNDLNFEETENESDKFNYQTLPEKTINGYLCKGVKATSDKYEMIMYFTDEAEVSFDDIYKNRNTKIPPQLKNHFNPDDKVLMMSMDFTDLKDKKQSGKMECVGLEKVSKTIRKSDYRFM